MDSVNLLFTFLALIVSVQCKLIGDHVCQKEIIVPKEQAKWELRNRTMRSYKWCINVPPRCSYYYNKIVSERVTVIVNITESTEDCCEGFQQKDDYCVSQCPQCLNGLCLRGTCVCQIGWNGPKCDNQITSTEATSTAKQSPTTSIEDLIEGSGSSTQKSQEKPYIPVTQSEEELSESKEDPILIESLQSTTQREYLSSSPSTSTTTWKSINVLTKPVIHAKEENTILKEHLSRTEDEFLENSRQSSRESGNIQLEDAKSDDKGLIYSVCAVSLVTFFVLVAAVTLYAMKSSKWKSMQKKQSENKEVNGVFHVSSLPESPMFDNPTYLSSTQNHNLEIQDFKVVFHKPLRAQSLDCRSYFYDHPPSKSSTFRALSTEVDSRFKHYNSEPVYAEIPNGNESNVLYMNTSSTKL
ncbi:hypothetical protein ABEB36_012290 [Hypothenemus hampei]|uniref:EMI domain-containing protein n=1 Tax=Hypothenemus hampei TaxID=57062 RepID=A0ABD1EAP1_HYPHA